MSRVSRLGRSEWQVSAPLALVAIFLFLLLVAGGASRADVIAQPLIRASAFAIAAIAVLIGPRPSFARVRPVVIFLAVIAALPMIQLMPLPSDWWQALPQRSIYIPPDGLTGWRAITVSPDATLNALVSLSIPATMLLLLSQADDRVIERLPLMLLIMIGAAAVVGVYQMSGARFDHPLLNDRGGVTGVFANRSHFALLLAIGIATSSCWAYLDGSAPLWRLSTAFALIAVFTLTAVASGSRTGLLLSGSALVFVAVSTARAFRTALKAAPRWLFITALVTPVLGAAILVALSVSANRAVAIERLLRLEPTNDLRLQAAPTIVQLAKDYFPFGSGFGTFDPVFRTVEPDNLLDTSYFNQAHNDILGVILDGGILSVIVLGVAFIWWAVVTVRVWRARRRPEIDLARLGSLIIFLTFVESTTDYAARTPIIMSILVIASTFVALVDVRARPDKQLLKSATKLAR